MLKLLLLAMISTNFLYAQNTIDLRQGFGPIRDQGSLGTCYAVSMADSLTYWLKQNGIKREDPVSALAIELQHHAYSRSLYFEGKKIEQRIKSEKLDPEKLRQEASQNVAGIENKLRKLRSSIVDNDAILRSAKNEIMKKDVFCNGTDDCLYMYAVSSTSTSKEDLEKINLLRKQIIEAVNKDPEVNKTQKELLKQKQTLLCVQMLKLNPNYFSNTPDDYEQEGGSWNKFIDMSSYKICFEKEVPSEQTGIPQEEQSLLAIDNNIRSEEFIGNELKNIYSGYSANGNDQAICKATSSAKTIFPTVRKNKLKRILTRSYRKGEDAIMKIIDDTCTFKLADKPKINDLDASSVVSLFPKIDELLARKIPVMIGYDPLVFRYGGAWLVKQDLSERHMSIIVGLTKAKDGSNEYIIRNSWGKNSCNDLYKKFLSLTDEQEDSLMDEAINKVQCECHQPGVDYDSCKKQATDELNKKRFELAAKSDRTYRCDNDGYFIVSKKALEQVLFKIVYLE
ncbi:MAG: hypothetical protein WCQ53_01875 [bacterium]